MFVLLVFNVRIAIFVGERVRFWVWDKEIGEVENFEFFNFVRFFFLLEEIFFFIWEEKVFFWINIF